MEALSDKPISKDALLDKDAPPVTYVVSDCPKGGVHYFINRFTTCGIIWAICCFPAGLLCCLAMQDHICEKCGQSAMDPHNPL